MREFEAHLRELQSLMQRAEEDQTRPRTPPQYRDERSAPAPLQPAPRPPPPRRYTVPDDPSDDDADLSVELNPDSAGHEAMQRVKEIERARAERRRRSLHAQRVEDERRWNELDLSDASVAPPPRKPAATTAHRAGSRPHARSAAPPQPQPRRRSISPPSLFEHLGSVERPRVPSHLSQSIPLPKRGGATSAGNPLNTPAWKRLHDVAADQGWNLRNEQQQVHPVDAATMRASAPQPALTQWPFLSAKPVRISYEQAARQQSQSSAQPRRSIYAAVGRSRSRSPHRGQDEKSNEEFRPSALLSPSASELFAMQLEAIDVAQKQEALRGRRQTERLQEQQRRSVAEIVRSPERLRSTQRVQPASPPPPPRSPPAATSRPQPKSQPLPLPITPSSPLSASDQPSPPSSPPTPPRRVRAVDHMRRTPRIEPPVVLRSPIRVLPPSDPAPTLGELEFAPLPSFASTPALSSAAHSPSLSPIRARTASPIRAPAREASPLRPAAYSSSPPRVAAAPAQSPLRHSMAPSSPRFEQPHPSSSLAYTPPLSSSLAFTPPPQQAASLGSPARSLEVTFSSVRMHSSELADDDEYDADDRRSDTWSLASESPRHAPAMQPSPPTSPPPPPQLRPPVASPSSLAFDASMRASFGASFGALTEKTSASVSVLFGSPESSGRRAPRPSPEAARIERRLLRYSLLLPATSSPRTR